MKLQLNKRNLAIFIFVVIVVVLIVLAIIGYSTGWWEASAK